MNDHSKELQAALLKLESYSPDELIRVRSRLFIWKLWCIAGWLTAGVCVVLTALR